MLTVPFSRMLVSMVPAFVLITLTSGACTENPIRPTLQATTVGPDCTIACQGEDPDPSAPGIYLGALDPYECFESGGTDADQDGLVDLCERTVASSFAPELYYYNGDNVGREPYWVARPDSTDRIVVGYLLSYYRDEGSHAWLCGLPGAPSSCHGHNGDSEAIFLYIYYNGATQHWILDQAWYSQHTDYGVYSRGSNAYPTALTYPSHPGTYPRAYVSEGKHANYASQDECNGGGTFGTDTCEDVNTAARVEFATYYNVGSRATPLIDCVASRNPSYEYYGSGRLECYWTDQRFRGWIPLTVGGDDADPYSPRLQGMGF